MAGTGISGCARLPDPPRATTGLARTTSAGPARTGKPTASLDLGSRLRSHGTLYRGQRGASKKYVGDDG